jgi:hypothetical protein
MRIPGVFKGVLACLSFCISSIFVAFGSNNKLL